MSRNSNQPCEDLPREGFVRLPVVLRHIPVGKTVWYEGIKSGRFPAPVKLGEATVAWRAADIRKLIGAFEMGVVAMPKPKKKANKKKYKS